MILSGLFVSWLIDHLVQRNVVARPDARSMHTVSTPVGGGWPVIGLTLLAWIALFWPLAPLLMLVIPLCAFLLALLSWFDDRHLLPAIVRFGLQIAAISCVLVFVPFERTVFSSDWPLLADRLLTGLCWLWFVNLFNFMDGIDGLAGVEVLFICAGLFTIGLLLGETVQELYLVVVLAGASAGFLWWNWHPAHIFLGDVGSISIGFLLGWLLIDLAMRGQLVAALLLPASFVTDATLTLLKRLVRGETIWRAHKTHFFQRAAMAVGSHAFIVAKISAANLGLFMLAVLSLSYPVLAATGGVVVLILLLIVLQKLAKS